MSAEILVGSLGAPQRPHPTMANGSPIQKLQLSVLGNAIRPLTFGADPQSVDIATNPSRSFPSQRAAFVCILVLKLIQQEEAVDRAVMHLMPAQRRKGSLAISIRQHRYRSTASRRWGIRAMVHHRVIHGPMVHPLHAAMIHLAVVHVRRFGHRLTVFHFAVINRRGFLLLLTRAHLSVVHAWHRVCRRSGIHFHGSVPHCRMVHLLSSKAGRSTQHAE